LDELVGLVGPMHNLLDNLTWTVVLNWLILFIFFFLPYQLGSRALGLLHPEPKADDGRHMAAPFAIGYSCLLAAGYVYYALGSPDTNVRRVLAFLGVFLKVGARVEKR